MEYIHEEYDKFIQNILDTRGRFGIPEGEYKERHHIIPRCIGGTDDEGNLIDLYAWEHFEAHKLLALENKHNSKLLWAWHLMSNLNDKQICDSNEYNELKLAYHFMMSEHNGSKTESHRKKNSKSHMGKLNGMYGKTHSEQAKKSMSEKRLGKYQSKDHIEKRVVSIRKKVMCIETGAIFESLAKAREWLKETKNIKTNITSAIKKGHRAGGYHWVYV